MTILFGAILCYSAVIFSMMTVGMFIKSLQGKVELADKIVVPALFFTTIFLWMALYHLITTN